jgi:hypothetical protein
MRARSTPDYNPWADRRNAGKPIRYDDGGSKSVMIGRVLYHAPEEPKEPQRTIVSYEETKVQCHSGDTLEDILRKLPAGTPLKDIRVKTQDGGTSFTFDRRVEIENIFFDEEMKLYHVQTVAYEAALKLWQIRVLTARHAAVSEGNALFEDALTKGKKRHSINPQEAAQSREMTREWLKTLGEDRVDATTDLTPSQEMKDFGEKMREGKLEKIEFQGFSVYVDNPNEKTSVRELVKEVLQETLDESVEIEVEEDDKSS